MSEERHTCSTVRRRSALVVTEPFKTPPAGPSLNGVFGQIAILLYRVNRDHDFKKLSQNLFLNNSYFAT